MLAYKYFNIYDVHERQTVNKSITLRANYIKIVFVA